MNENAAEIDDAKSKAKQLKYNGKRPSTKKSRKSRKRKPAARRTARKVGTTRGGARTRHARPYPAAPFEEALVLADAIQTYASGQRVRRLTLLGKMNKSPNSGPTKMLITTSGKYGLTTGSYTAEYLELTELGKTASSPDTDRLAKVSAQFDLAIRGVEPFRLLYEEYKNKKLPVHDVLRDVLRDNEIPEEHVVECVDTFIVNAKFLGLLRTIAGSEMLVPIEQVLEEGGAPVSTALGLAKPPANAAVGKGTLTEEAAPKTKWSKTCFYISPIGDEDSEIREHSDLFLNSIVEPALQEFGLDVVRADMIGQAGMITSQILEHVMRAKLAIVDLSWHNPNAFYEMAIRHACKLPVCTNMSKG